VSYIVVDVESDGPCPGLYSMVSFGAVVVSPALNDTFYGQTRPISDKWMPEALAISGITREQHAAYPHPFETMKAFREWLRYASKGKPTFISDNPAFDWQFINYYFHLYLSENPFGFSARRIGDLYCGMVKDAGQNKEWKRRFRITKHTHHPVDDAKGNAEALLEMKRLGLRLVL
jgi:DNA polymerase III epsilon subunit-like protein